MVVMEQMLCMKQTTEIADLDIGMSSNTPVASTTLTQPTVQSPLFKFQLKPNGFGQETLYIFNDSQARLS